MQRSEKEAKLSRDDADRKWKQEVSDLTRSEPQSLSIHKLKALLSLLLHYMSMAPCKEEEDSLRKYITLVRTEINSRVEAGRLEIDSG